VPAPQRRRLRRHPRHPPRRRGLRPHRRRDARRAGALHRRGQRRPASHHHARPRRPVRADGPALPGAGRRPRGSRRPAAAADGGRGPLLRHLHLRHDRPAQGRVHLPLERHHLRRGHPGGLRRPRGRPGHPGLLPVLRRLGRATLDGLRHRGDARGRHPARRWTPLSRPKTRPPSLRRWENSFPPRPAPGHSCSPRTPFTPAAEGVRGEQECLLTPPNAAPPDKPLPASGSPRTGAAALRCSSRSTASARPPAAAPPRSDAGTRPRT